jgi:hypothetical protein
MITSTFWNAFAAVVYPLMFFSSGVSALLYMFGHPIILTRREAITFYTCTALIAIGLGLTNGYFSTSFVGIIKPMVRVLFGIEAGILTYKLVGIMRMLLHRQRNGHDG